MPSVRGAIALPQHHVGVEFVLVPLDGDIAKQGKYLHLLCDRDVLIITTLQVEVAQHHLPKGPDPAELAGEEILFARKRFQLGDHLVAFIEDKGKGPLGRLVQ